MKILVVGSGGREHAIVDSLARSRHKPKIYAAPGNGGIRQQAELVPISADDIAALAEFARSNRIDLTFIGPEIPLSKGVVDVFRNKDLPIVGPAASEARLESSKIYAKRFFRTNKIPTADFRECSTASQAYAALEEFRYPIVVKADGLAGGKGVIVCQDREQAVQAVQNFIEAKSLGDAGSRVVIEEFLTGVEASFHVFADGASFQPMVAARDHKRRFDGDTGPNTGGMGAYSTDAILSVDQYNSIIDGVIQPTLQAASKYSGVLYAGLMLTTDGPKLLEYNARFGDPETQVILPRLKTDLVDVLVDISEHRLGLRHLEWRSDAVAAVVLVVKGYPGKIETGSEILGLGDAERIDGVKVFHAGTRWEDGKVYTSGGRVLNVTARGDTLAEALERAYFVAEMIEFDGKDYRRDIGRKGS